jgi:hypothetical protein
VLLIAVLSALTVNLYAPRYFNADVSLFSLMSLQNITIFFWGQDRLANVLPVLVWVFRNPTANLCAVLLFAAATHYALLLLLAHIAVTHTRKAEDEAPSTASFLAVFLYVLRWL